MIKGLLLGFVIALIVLPIGLLIYLRFGHPPVAVADKPFPLEEAIVQIPLHAKIDAEAPKSAPH